MIDGSVVESYLYGAVMDARVQSGDRISVFD